jgi:hypothetical protein
MTKNDFLKSIRKYPRWNKKGEQVPKPITRWDGRPFTRKDMRQDLIDMQEQRHEAIEQSESLIGNRFMTSVKQDRVVLYTDEAYRLIYEIGGFAGRETTRKGKDQ